MILSKYQLNVNKIYLLKLSAPIFLANLSIPLVGVIDTFLMGHLEDQIYLVATGVSTSVITMIFWTFGFLRMGTVGLVAQSLGRGDYQEIVSTIIRNLFIAIVLSILVIGSLSFILQSINYFFQISGETLNLIDKYITIRIVSAPAELIIYVLTGLYLGLQKTIISSSIIIFFSLLNIILSIIFVTEFNLNIVGVSLGTTLSAYITILIFLVSTYFYIKTKLKVIPRINKSILNRKKIIKLFHINFDIFLRTILLTFSFLWVTYLGSLLGENIIATNLILLQFILVASFFLDAYAFSTEGIVGFTLGRRSEKSFIMAVKNSIELSFYTAILISIFYTFFSKSMINLFTDLEIIRYYSYSYIFWIIIIPPIASFAYQFDGIFLGTSQTGQIRNAMIISVFLYIGSSLYLIKFFDNHGIWLSLLIFMIARAVTLYLYFPSVRKKFR